MSFNGIDKLRPVGGIPTWPKPPAPANPPPVDPSRIFGRKCTGVIIDDLECRGCGASLSHGEPACTFCKRPNPFALARQAAKAIEITQLDDYAPRFIFDGTLTPNEAREFASMWARKHSQPGAIITLPAGVEFARDGAYALKPLPPPSRVRFESDTGSPSLLSRLITRLFR